MTPRSSKISTLDAAIRAHVEPGMHLNFASTPSRSNAAVREVARAFRGKNPRFEISATGLHSLAHVLGVLRLGRRYVTCFVGDNYPVSRPSALYAELRAEGAEIELWSLWSYVSALRAAALGHPYAFTRSLHGSDMGRDLARSGAFRELPLSPESPEPAGLVRALRPDVTFVHAPLAADDGTLYFSPPHSEGLWGAHAASRGVIATVERIITTAEAIALGEALRFPAHRLLAVAVEPFGAHPQPLYTTPRFGVLDCAGYADDFAHYERWRELGASPRAFAAFASEVLDAPDGSAAYRAWVGDARLTQLADEARDLAAAVARARSHGEALHVRRRPDRAPPHDEDAGRIPPLGPDAARDSSRPDAPARANEVMLALAARRIAQRVRSERYPVILAGIGHSFLAARMARRVLAEEGIDVIVMVETGLFDIECGPSADEFLLSHRSAALARGLSSVEDILGILTCGANARCLGVVGAAQVDATGALNSTRVGDKWLVGSGGANDIASCAAEVIVLARTGAGRLVTKVDYVTSPGRAVRSVVTDMCAFSRGAADATSWSVEDVYPVLGGRAPSYVIAAIRDSCPWTVLTQADAEYAPLISTAEMALIHSLDPDGIHWRRDASRIR